MDFFHFVACPCSFRTVEEEARYGSYCSDCWSVIKNHMQCVLCSSPVQKERLYVDTIYFVPTCKRCFSSKDFNRLQEEKGFQRKGKLDPIFNEVIKYMETRRKDEK